MNTEAYKKTKEKALWLLSRRDYSKKELIKKLSDISDEMCAADAAERMEELGLINDEKFAQRYAEKLSAAKYLSDKSILYKLLEKGIDRELAEEIIENLDIDSLNQIKSIIKKKYIKYLDDEKGVKKTISALLRLGHTWEDIKKAMEEIEEIEEDQEDEI